MNYQGWAILMDCYMLARADLSELRDLPDYQYAVIAVKHEHVPNKHYRLGGGVLAAEWFAARDAAFRLWD